MNTGAAFKTRGERGCPVSFSLPDSLINQLDTIALRRKWSRATLIRETVLEMLEREERDAKED